MGYKQNGFLFQSDWAVDDNKVGEWMDSTTLSRLILAPLAEDGLLTSTRHLSIDLGEPSSIGTNDELDRLVRHGDNQLIVLSAGTPEDEDVLVHIALNRGGARITVGLAPVFLSKNQRERASCWVKRWSELLAERQCRLQTATFEPESRNYPRPRPPHRHSTWRLGVLDLYLGKSWHQHSEERRTILTTIETAPLPSSARRTTDDDIVRIAFGIDPEVALGDAEAVSAARRAQEDWLTPLIPADRERGWNALGDRLVAVVELDDKEPFTFYDPRYSVGYKAMIVDPDSGEIDEKMWAELKKIARDKKLPDGTEVKGVRLIFPVRENALQMHERTIADGFEMATYPGSPQIFWQVNPS